MLAKLGPLVSHAAGSIAGTTFARSASGLVVKSKPLPVYRNTSFAMAARSRTSAINKAWLAMSSADRLDWGTFAATQVFTNKFGDVVASTAYKAFTRCNMASFVSRSGATVLPLTLTAPVAVFGTLPTLPRFTLSVASKVMLLDSTSATVDALTWLGLFATQPRRPVTRPGVQGFPRVPFLFERKGGEALPFDITGHYVTLFGRLPDDTKGEGATLRIHAYDDATRYPALFTDLPLEYV